MSQGLSRAFINIDARLRRPPKPGPQGIEVDQSLGCTCCLGATAIMILIDVLSKLLEEYDQSFLLLGSSLEGR
jgi:hypothetical protein